MVKGKIKYFDTVELPSSDNGKYRGVVFINDLSSSSDFIFRDWGLPIIRPKSMDCSKSLANILSDVNLSMSFKNPHLDELAEYSIERLNIHQSVEQDVFFIIVSFDQKQLEKFGLFFSNRANPKLIEPVTKNFSLSGQNFCVFNSHKNVLFKKIETSIPGVSCFELRFGNQVDSIIDGAYSKERIFEETMIFSNLAALKMI